jgi:hypothetical protein
MLLSYVLENGRNEVHKGDGHHEILYSRDGWQVKARPKPVDRLQRVLSPLKVVADNISQNPTIFIVKAL